MQLVAHPPLQGLVDHLVLLHPGLALERRRDDVGRVVVTVAAQVLDVDLGVADRLFDQAFLGLPFTEGRTIARAGKATNLMDAVPAYRFLAKPLAQKFGQTHLGRRVRQFWRNAGKKLYFGKNFNTVTGRNLASNMESRVAIADRDAGGRLGEIFKGFGEKDALEDFGQSLIGMDVRKTGVLDADTFKQAHPALAGRYDEAL